MSRTTLALLLGSALVLSITTAGNAQSAVDQRLADEAAAFVADEADGASPAERETMVACLLAEFAGLDDAEKEELLAEDDFEDSLDALIMAHPETEDALENCLG